MRILVTCYAVNPYKGSEDGIGWNWIIQIARNQEVIVITRENNEKNIERYMKENPSEIYENIEFQYYDLPAWMRFWKKKGRGAMLYYYLWQRGIVRFIIRKQFRFDISHNLNFCNDWTPSFLWKLEEPFVWGPIGHHDKIPKQYLAKYPKKQLFSDRLRWAVKKWFWKFSPNLKKTRNLASAIIMLNSRVSNVLSINVDNTKNFQMHACSSEENIPKENTIDEKIVLSVGRITALKGFDLTIQAFQKFLDRTPEYARTQYELVIIGSGDAECMIKKMVKKEHRFNIRFINWIEREELKKYYRIASAFLFPSHEGAGMVVPEALSYSLPVICLDNAGPGEFINEDCGYKVPLTDYDHTIDGLAKALDHLFNTKGELQKKQKNAYAYFMEHLTWHAKGDFIKKIYTKIYHENYINSPTE